MLYINTFLSQRPYKIILMFSLTLANNKVRCIWAV